MAMSTDGWSGAAVAHVTQMMLHAGWPIHVVAPLARSCRAGEAEATVHVRGLAIWTGPRGNLLHRAVAVGDTARLRALLAAVPRTTLKLALRQRRGDYGYPVGAYALAAGNVEAVALLLTAGASLEEMAGLRGFKRDASVYALLTKDNNEDWRSDEPTADAPPSDADIAACLRALAAAGATAAGGNYGLLWIPVAGETAGGHSLLHVALTERKVGAETMRALLALPGARAHLATCSPLSGTPLAAALIYSCGGGGDVAARTAGVTAALLGAGADVGHPSVGEAPLKLCENLVRCLRTVRCA